MRSYLQSTTLALLLAPVAVFAADAPLRQGWAHEDKLVELGPSQRGQTAQTIDRLMIQEAFSRWGIAFDEGRENVIVSLFQKDGTLEFMKGSGTAMSAIHGAKEIGAFAVKAQKGQGDQRRHLISNVVVESLDGDKALAWAYSVVTATNGGDITIASSVIYRAELQKEPDGIWRFSRFVIGMDAYDGGAASKK